MCLAPSVAYGARCRERRGCYRRVPVIILFAVGARSACISYCAGDALARAATRRDATQREDVYDDGADLVGRALPNVSPDWRRERRTCTREKTESVRAFFGVAWDEDEAMDAWMYDVMLYSSSLTFTRREGHFSGVETVSYFERYEI
ncbi:hypothetical protein G5I_07799 [Acromyrmex echinatior]|uniref:Uncharacterized protein n=1 Tax=Acromyrmex echinatior TaxID=103372 RepID=F4WPT5_ACREC|nr:hypothetical protein G5I_07799 [Acromyrmex echinatior]